MAKGYQPIEQPARDLARRCGGTYEQVSAVSVPGYPCLQMADFQGYRQHCSLTALTSVFAYYRAAGYTWIQPNDHTLFLRIRTLARRRGIHYGRLLLIPGGTCPFLIDRLARTIWSFYGYPKGRAKNHLFMQSGRRAEAFVRDEIEAGRPFLLSMSGGYYRNHTVTVWGYEVWAKADAPEQWYLYLKVNDHWSRSPRYIHLYSLDPFYGGPLFEICQILPPPNLHQAIEAPAPVSE